MPSNTTQESLSVWNRQLIQERNARGAAGVTVRQLESLIRCGSAGNGVRTGSPRNRLCSVARDDGWDFECMRCYVISMIEIIAAGWTQDLAKVWNKQGFFEFHMGFVWECKMGARCCSSTAFLPGCQRPLHESTSANMWSLSLESIFEQIHGCEFLWIWRRNDVLIRAEHVREAFELQVRGRVRMREVEFNKYCYVCVSGYINIGIHSICIWIYNINICIYIYIIYNCDKTCNLEFCICEPGEGLSTEFLQWIKPYKI